jgi:hypothetical protein
MLDAEHRLFYDGMMLEYSAYQRAGRDLKQRRPDRKAAPVYGLHEVDVRPK